MSDAAKAYGDDSISEFDRKRAVYRIRNLLAEALVEKTPSEVSKLIADKAKKRGRTQKQIIDWMEDDLLSRRSFKEEWEERDG